jgi:hypothetical protein
MGWGNKKAPGLFAESYLIQTQTPKGSSRGAKAFVFPLGVVI